MSPALATSDAVFPYKFSGTGESKEWNQRDNARHVPKASTFTTCFVLLFLFHFSPLPVDSRSVPESERT